MLFQIYGDNAGWQLLGWVLVFAGRDRDHCTGSECDLSGSNHQESERAA